MKYVAVVLALCLVVSCAAAQGLKMYGLKSGVIEYKHFGTREGTSTMYFDEYGNKSAAYTDASSGGRADKGWVISLGETQYIFKPGDTRGMKMKNPMVEAMQKTGDIEKYTEEMYSKMGLKPAGTETFLGKECRKYIGENGKVLIWNGLLMYMNVKVMGVESRQEATKVEVNVPVKASLFELPKDVKFSELPVFPPGIRINK